MHLQNSCLKFVNQQYLLQEIPLIQLSVYVIQELPWKTQHKNLLYVVAGGYIF